MLFTRMWDIPLDSMSHLIYSKVMVDSTIDSEKLRKSAEVFVLACSLLDWKDEDLREKLKEKWQIDDLNFEEFFKSLESTCHYIAANLMEANDESSTRATWREVLARRMEDADWKLLEFQKVADNLKPDAKKRVVLPVKQFSELYDAYVNNRGQILLDPLVAIPASEAWLFEDKKALADVMRGFADEDQGRTKIIDPTTL
jgi:hypothetical protein